MIQDIIDIAKNAGEIILKIKQEGIEVSTKFDKGSEGEYLTQADLTADKYIIETLTKLVPGDQILTEETASETIIDRTKTVWIVDPIDGTKNYATGSDVFAVLIGRCTNGIPDLGVSHFPALKKTFYAQKGGGAFLNGKKLEKINESTNNPYQFSRPSNMEFTFDGTSYHNQRAETLPGVKSYSCLGRSIMQVALSKLEGVGGITQRGKRDTCSGHVILEEVGGKFTTSNGDALDYSTPSHSWSTGCIASKATAHQKIVDFIPAVK